MANAKKCDRCGRFYDFYEGIEFTAGANRYTYVVLASGESVNERRFDMCPDCMRQVIRFLHNESNTHSFKCKNCKHWRTLINSTPCVSCKRIKPECDNDRFEYDEKKEGE